MWPRGCGASILCGGGVQERTRQGQIPTARRVLAFGAAGPALARSCSRSAAAGHLGDAIRLARSRFMRSAATCARSGMPRPGMREFHHLTLDLHHAER